MISIWFRIYLITGWNIVRKIYKIDLYKKIADLIVRTALKQSKMEKMLLFLNEHERCWISVWNEDWFHLVQQSEIASIFEILKILVIHAVFMLVKLTQILRLKSYKQVFIHCQNIYKNLFMQTMSKILRIKILSGIVITRWWRDSNLFISWKGWTLKVSTGDWTHLPSSKTEW